MSEGTVQYPEDMPSWTCCGGKDCPFAAKCADIERLDRAYIKRQQQQKQQRGE